MLIARLGWAGDATHKVCPRLEFKGPEIKLSKMEKELVCGDPKTEGWRNVSLPQARDFMTAFLQHRGRHFPTFTTDGDTLVVEIGTTTKVTKLTGSGLQGIYDLGKRRKIVGQLLTPELLDTVQKAVVFELQARSYACPKVTVTADARSGEVHVDVTPGLLYEMVPVPRAQLHNLDPGVFNRYEAFVVGAPFDNRMLSMTSDRIEKDALFLSAYYDVDCTTGGLHVTQRVVEARPNLIKVGVGADTEGLLRARAEYQNSRLGYRASSVDVQAFASRRQQSLEGILKYFLRPEDRVHLEPDIFVRRDDQIRWQAAHSEASLSPAWSHDGEDFRLDVRGGPAVDYFNTLNGIGPRRETWFAFVTRTELKTHLFEFYANDPRQGWSATLETSSRQAGYYSPITAHWMKVTGESLWNLGKYDPPLMVLATRGFAGTTWSSDRTIDSAEISPAERFFLGGDADIRGFYLEQLPLTSAGFLTAAYEGVELRMGDVLPQNLQPFAFIDSAMGGSRDFHLDGDVYYAPGVGIRWPSPIGAIRATVGRGQVWRRGSPYEAPHSQWQFFFSLGREF